MSIDAACSGHGECAEILEAALEACIARPGTASCNAAPTSSSARATAKTAAALADTPMPFGRVAK